MLDPEPPPEDSPLRYMPNVILTSHIAAFSPDAMRNLREMSARTVLAAFRGEALSNVVNGV